MNWLIRFFGARFARQIEHGSPAGAALGAAAGVASCVAVAYALHRAGRVGNEWKFFAVALGCVGGIVGALLGSLRAPSVGSVVSPVDRHAVVRVTNLNRALVPVIVFVILAVVLVALAASAARRDDAPWLYLSVIGAVTVAVALIASRQMLWVDFGENVTVRRVLTTRRYARDQVRQWGFEVARGRLEQSVPHMPCPFLVDLRDGLRIELRVPPHKRELLVRVMDVPGCGPSARLG